jgi:hypothetical protein
MPERYPGYDVLDKRDTPSWNDATRAVVDVRLAVADTPQFLDAAAWQTLHAVCERIVPQRRDSAGRAPVPLAALVDHRLLGDERDGYRNVLLPPLRDAWLLGLVALDAEALAAHGEHFHTLPPERQDALLAAMQAGHITDAAWQGMPPALFFSERLAHDILAAYYAHPTSWSEIGFGGPAGPRGYVRMYFNRRDPWEAAEAHPGEEEKARETNRHAR